MEAEFYFYLCDVLNATALTNLEKLTGPRNAISSHLSRVCPDQLYLCAVTQIPAGPVCAMLSADQTGAAARTGLIGGGSTLLNLQPDFFVPAYPLWMVLVPYGLYLTFTSYLCPTCLPASLPAAPLARWLGTNANFLMGLVSAVAAALHVGEAAQAWFLASRVYRLHSTAVALWTLNVFLFGIFGFWPLAFPDIFYFVSEFYCDIPGAACFGV